ncbi:dynamin family protein [Propionispora hippei]|uniref:Dynamin family protein n=1 Tax=Propionispora hippei DSM 15287 TaxID=1123003 RepID=A0A1M6NMJ5_9FIRM|nr:dynamin family protein [Propionispora hippei]SHJ96782.1 Dynamin family protein [Propionispora hippei DSM 15287]
MKYDRMPEQEACLTGLLEEAAGQLRQVGNRFIPHAVRVENLAERLREKQFHLAVLGQFKRGKSSLINALLGGPFLPSSLVPVTALPTVIRQGIGRRAYITFADGREDQGVFDDDVSLADYLSRFVAEQANPANCLQVEQVIVEYPAALLAGGVVLIDTPGIGSTFRHNTDTTLRFLAQCDAALFVVSADPPVTAAELAFLQIVQHHVRRLFFVLNKADHLSGEEQDTMVSFLRQVLREQAGITVETVYRVSARQAVLGKERGDSRLLAASGLGLLEEALTAFFRQEMQAVLAVAIETKLAVVLREALLELELAVQVLLMPVDELAAKQATLRQKLTELTAEEQQADDVLAGDRKRALDFLEKQADVLRRKARDYLSHVVAKELSGGERPGLERDAQTALMAAVAPFFDRELSATADQFSDYLAGVMAVHQQRAEALIQAVRQTAATIFALDYQAVEQELTFQMKRQPYWVKTEWQTGLGGIPHTWLEVLLPASFRFVRIRKRLERQVEALVLRNVESLRWALLQNTEAAFHSFRAAFSARLAEAVDGTAQAVAAAAEQKQGQTEDVADRCSRLQRAARQMQQLLQQVTTVEPEFGKAVAIDAESDRLI